MRIQAKIDGLKSVTDNLAALKRGVRNRVTRKMVGAGCTPILAASKALCPRRKGLLKKSLGRKIKTYSSGAIAGIIGPRKGFRQQVGVRRDGTPIYEDPAKIAHLVEGGHGGPRPAPPYPFMRPAYDGQRDAARSAMLRAGKEGLEVEARKLARKK